MLDLQLSLDQSHLPLHDDCVRHLIARITPPETSSHRERAPLDLAVVIDASGSMNGPPLEAAKQATLQLAHELPESTRLTVVSFAQDVIVHIDGCLLGADVRAEVHEHIAQLRPRGMTNLHGGWRTACTLLDSSSGAAGRRRHVVVLSDGRANVGMRSPRELASESSDQLQRGITTSCIGIGDHYSPNQLTALAEHGGGECHDAEDAREIVEILLGEVLSLAEVCAENLKLVVDVPGQVTARELSGMPGAFDQGRLTVHAGAVRDGIERTIIVRLGIPASAGHSTSPGTVDVTARIEWTDSSAAAHSSARASTPQSTQAARAQATRSPNHPAPPSLVDARAVLIAWQSYLVRAVTSMNRDRDFPGIEALWQQEFEPFLSYAGYHPELHDFTRTLHQIRRRSTRPIPERSLKLTADMARKRAKGTTPHYTRKKGTIADHFGPA